MAPKQKINKRNAHKRRVFKNPYLNFMEDFREEVKCRNFKPNQLFEEAGRRWREMSELQKQPYKEVAVRAPKLKRSRDQHSYIKKMNSSARKYQRGMKYNVAQRHEKSSRSSSIVSEHSKTSATSFASSEM